MTITMITMMIITMGKIMMIGKILPEKCNYSMANGRTS